MNFLSFFGALLCSVFADETNLESILDLTKKSITLTKIHNGVPILESEGRLFVPFLLRAKSPSELTSTGFADDLRKYVNKLLHKHYPDQEGKTVKNYSVHANVKPRTLFNITGYESATNPANVEGIPIALPVNSPDAKTGPSMGIPIKNMKISTNGIALNTGRKKKQNVYSKTFFSLDSIVGTSESKNIIKSPVPTKQSKYIFKSAVPTSQPKNIITSAIGKRVENNIINKSLTGNFRKAFVHQKTNSSLNNRSFTKPRTVKVLWPNANANKFEKQDHFDHRKRPFELAGKRSKKKLDEDGLPTKYITGVLSNESTSGLNLTIEIKKHQSNINAKTIRNKQDNFVIWEVPLLENTKEGKYKSHIDNKFKFNRTNSQPAKKERFDTFDINYRNRSTEYEIPKEAKLHESEAKLPQIVNLKTSTNLSQDKEIYVDKWKELLHNSHSSQRVGDNTSTISRQLPEIHFKNQISVRKMSPMPNMEQRKQTTKQQSQPKNNVILRRHNENKDLVKQVNNVVNKPPSIQIPSTVDMFNNINTKEEINKNHSKYEKQNSLHKIKMKNQEMTGLKKQKRKDHLELSTEVANPDSKNTELSNIDNDSTSRKRRKNDLLLNIMNNKTKKSSQKKNPDFQKEKQSIKVLNSNVPVMETAHDAENETIDRKRNTRKKNLLLNIMNYKTNRTHRKKKTIFQTEKETREVVNSNVPISDKTHGAAEKNVQSMSAIKRDNTKIKMVLNEKHPARIQKVKDILNVHLNGTTSAVSSNVGNYVPNTTTNGSNTKIDFEDPNQTFVKNISSETITSDETINNRKTMDSFIVYSDRIQPIVDSNFRLSDLNRNKNATSTQILSEKHILFKNRENNNRLHGDKSISVSKLIYSKKVSHRKHVNDKLNEKEDNLSTRTNKNQRNTISKVIMNTELPLHTEGVLTDHRYGIKTQDQDFLKKTSKQNKSDEFRSRRRGKKSNTKISGTRRQRLEKLQQINLPATLSNSNADSKRENTELNTTAKDYSDSDRASKQLRTMSSVVNRVQNDSNKKIRQGRTNNANQNSFSTSEHEKWIKKNEETFTSGAPYVKKPLRNRSAITSQHLLPRDRPEKDPGNSLDLKIKRKSLETLQMSTGFKSPQILGENEQKSHSSTASNNREVKDSIIRNNYKRSKHMKQHSKTKKQRQNLLPAAVDDNKKPVNNFEQVKHISSHLSSKQDRFNRFLLERDKKRLGTPNVETMAQPRSTNYKYHPPKEQLDNKDKILSQIIPKNTNVKTDQQREKVTRLQKQMSSSTHLHGDKKLTKLPGKRNIFSVQSFKEEANNNHMIDSTKSSNNFKRQNGQDLSESYNQDRSINDDQYDHSRLVIQVNRNKVTIAPDNNSNAQYHRQKNYHGVPNNDRDLSFESENSDYYSDYHEYKDYSDEYEYVDYSDEFETSGTNNYKDLNNKKEIPLYSTQTQISDRKKWLSQTENNDFDSYEYEDYSVDGDYQTNSDIGNRRAVVNRNQANRQPVSLTTNSDVGNRRAVVNRNQANRQPMSTNSNVDNRRAVVNRNQANRQPMSVTSLALEETLNSRDRSANEEDYASREDFVSESVEYDDYSLTDGISRTKLFKTDQGRSRSHNGDMSSVNSKISPSRQSTQMDYSSSNNGDSDISSWETNFSDNFEYSDEDNVRISKSVVPGVYTTPEYKTNKYIRNSEEDWTSEISDFIEESTEWDWGFCDY